MNKTNRYALYGQLIFTALIISILAVIYAAQAKITVLLFICAIVGIVLSLGLLILLLRLNKAFEEDEQEMLRLKQWENTYLQKKKQEASGNRQQTESIGTDELLSKIMSSLDKNFNNIEAYTEKILQIIAKELDIVQGLIFTLNNTDQLFHISGEYAYYSDEQPRSFSLGETLSGQVAKNQQLLNVIELPEGYITVLSGLGKSSPRHLVIVPILNQGDCIGIMELASFKPFVENDEMLVQKISELMANQLNELRS